MSPEAWSALANWVMAAAAVAAATAAILGINSWKAQNTWLLERDARRTALRSLLRLARELSDARKPDFARLTFGKAETASSVYPHSVQSDREHLLSIEVVQQAHREFQAAMFDLEYLGDTELRRAREEIDGLIDRYLAQTNIYLRWKHREFPQVNAKFFLSEQHKEDNYDVVFEDIRRVLARDEGEHNDFSRKLEIAFTGLERKLAKSLGGAQ
jgi:hypothetical protein